MAGLPERARPQAIKRLTVELVPHRSEGETIDKSLGARCLLRLQGNRRAAEQRDELAPRDHSITSSARASSVGGTSRSSAFAVFRLITNSNLVACITCRSAGSLRTRPVYVPTWRYISARLLP